MALTWQKRYVAHEIYRSRKRVNCSRSMASRWPCQSLESWRIWFIFRLFEDAIVRLRMQRQVQWQLTYFSADSERSQTLHWGMQYCSWRSLQKTCTIPSSFTTKCLHIIAPVKRAHQNIHLGEVQETLGESPACVASQEGSSRRGEALMHHQTSTGVLLLQEVGTSREMHSSCRHFIQVSLHSTSCTEDTFLHRRRVYVAVK
jgi:hypothetical protein